MICSFFVYGTLMQGRLRSGLWPRSPIQIQPGIVQGSLFDLGVYPGLSDGSDSVLGELWEFHAEDIPATIRALDAIEGIVEGFDGNEYVRQTVLVECVTQNGSICEAYAYRMADPKQVTQVRRIEPWKQVHGRFVACWPDAHCRVPKSFAEE